MSTKIDVQQWIANQRPPTKPDETVTIPLEHLEGLLSVSVKTYEASARRIATERSLTMGAMQLLSEASIFVSSTDLIDAADRALGVDPLAPPAVGRNGERVATVVGFNALHGTVTLRFPGSVPDVVAGDRWLVEPPQAALMPGEGPDFHAEAMPLLRRMEIFLERTGWNREGDWWMDPHPELRGASSNSQGLLSAVEQQLKRCVEPLQVAERHWVSHRPEGGVVISHREMMDIIATEAAWAVAGCAAPAGSAERVCPKCGWRGYADRCRICTDETRMCVEVPCPDCFAGHFRPCQMCCNSGVALMQSPNR